MKFTHSTSWENETISHAIKNGLRINTLCGKWLKIESIDRDCPTCETCQEIQYDNRIENALEGAYDSKLEAE